VAFDPTIEEYKIQD